MCRRSALGLGACPPLCNVSALCSPLGTCPPLHDAPLLLPFATDRRAPGVWWPTRAPAGDARRPGRGWRGFPTRRRPAARRPPRRLTQSERGRCSATCGWSLWRHGRPMRPQRRGRPGTRRTHQGGGCRALRDAPPLLRRSPPLESHRLACARIDDGGVLARQERAVHGAVVEAWLWCYSD